MQSLTKRARLRWNEQLFVTVLNTAARLSWWAAVACGCKHDGANACPASIGTLSLLPCYKQSTPNTWALLKYTPALSCRSRHASRHMRQTTQGTPQALMSCSPTGPLLQQVPPSRPPHPAQPSQGQPAQPWSEPLPVLCCGACGHICELSTTSATTCSVSAASPP